MHERFASYNRTIFSYCHQTGRDWYWCIPHLCFVLIRLSTSVSFFLHKNQMYLSLTRHIKFRILCTLHTRFPILFCLLDEINILLLSDDKYIFLLFCFDYKNCCDISVAIKLFNMQFFFPFVMSIWNIGLRYSHRFEWKLF